MCSAEEDLSWILKSNQPLIYWLWTFKNHADKDTISSLWLRFQKALIKNLSHRHVPWLNSLNARHPWERFRSSLTSVGQLTQQEDSETAPQVEQDCVKHSWKYRTTLVEPGNQSPLIHYRKSISVPRHFSCSMSSKSCPLACSVAIPKKPGSGAA